MPIPPTDVVRLDGRVVAAHGGADCPPDDVAALAEDDRPEAVARPELGQRAVGDEFALGNEDDARDGEHQHQRKAEHQGDGDGSRRHQRRGVGGRAISLLAVGLVLARWLSDLVRVTVLPNVATSAGVTSATTFSTSVVIVMNVARGLSPQQSVKKT